MVDFLNGIIISEVLADNPNVTGGLDTNQDGTVGKSDEYIEFQNTTGADINLDGYEVWSQKNGLLHTFGEDLNGNPTTDIIAAGGTVLVLGDDDDGGIANYYSANGNNDGAQGNGGFLEDGENPKQDTLYLVAPNGDYILLFYGAGASDATIPANPPPGFPTGGTLQGDGESIDNAAGNTIAFGRDVDGTFIEVPPNPGGPGNVCFAAGTLIATDQGEIAVEDLTPDMRVLTRDNGYVPLRAMRGTELSAVELRWNPDMCPIMIPAGALGNATDLVLSPAHRVLVQGADVAVVCGETEALVPAHHLVGHAGISRLPADKPVTYYHLLFDAHEVLQSDGAWTESLFMGDIARDSLRAVAEWQVADGCDLDAIAHDKTARIVLKHFETTSLLHDRPAAQKADVEAA